MHKHNMECTKILVMGVAALFATPPATTPLTERHSAAPINYQVRQMGETAITITTVVLASTLSVRPQQRPLQGWQRLHTKLLDERRDSHFAHAASPGPDDLPLLSLNHADRMQRKHTGTLNHVCEHMTHVAHRSTLFLRPACALYRKLTTHLCRWTYISQHHG